MQYLDKPCATALAKTIITKTQITNYLDKYCRQAFKFNFKVIIDVTS